MNIFTMHRGDDKVYELTVTYKATGLPVDITGCTITMTWKENLSDSVPFLQKNFTLTNPASGVAEVTIDVADTNALTSRKEFFFDVYILRTTGKGETLCDGKFVVEPRVR